MFQKAKKDLRIPVSSGPETILGSGTSAEGSITSKGDIFIGGEFKGSIKSSGNVVVNKGVKVEAQITAVNVIIHGEVVGDVTASETVEVGNGGGVKGDVKAGSVRVAEGGHLVGSCTISTGEPPKPALPKPKEQ